MKRDPNWLAMYWYNRYFKNAMSAMEFKSIFLDNEGGDSEMAKIDYEAVKKEALKECTEEETEKAKREYKLKMKELAGAEKVVRNIKRELEDLDDKYSQE